MEGGTLEGNHSPELVVEDNSEGREVEVDWGRELEEDSGFVVEQLVEEKLSIPKFMLIE